MELKALIHNIFNQVQVITKFAHFRDQISSIPLVIGTLLLSSNELHDAKSSNKEGNMSNSKNSGNGLFYCSLRFMLYSYCKGYNLFKIFSCIFKPLDQNLISAANANFSECVDGGFIVDRTCKAFCPEKFTPIYPMAKI